MVRIGLEGNPGAAPEPVVAEAITLGSEQINNLLSRYRAAVLEFDRTVNWENPTVNNQPPAGRLQMHRDLTGILSSEVRTFKAVFGVMGISDRARQINDEVTFGESERRKQEAAALYGVTPVYVSIR